jgi:hypothetical protein
VSGAEYPIFIDINHAIPRDITFACGPPAIPHAVDDESVKGVNSDFTYRSGVLNNTLYVLNAHLAVADAYGRLHSNHEYSGVLLMCASVPLLLASRVVTVR